eukprot:1160809-Pelagomonas_calceolata.AAC.2
MLLAWTLRRAWPTQQCSWLGHSGVDGQGSNVLGVTEGVTYATVAQQRPAYILHAEAHSLPHWALLAEIGAKVVT